MKHFKYFALIVIGFHIILNNFSATDFKQIFGDQSVKQTVAFFPPNSKHVVLQTLFLTYPSFEVHRAVNPNLQSFAQNCPLNVIQICPQKNKVQFD